MSIFHSVDNRICKYHIVQTYDDMVVIILDRFLSVREQKKKTTTVAFFLLFDILFLCFRAEVAQW